MWCSELRWIGSDVRAGRKRRRDQRQIQHLVLLSAMDIEISTLDNGAELTSGLNDKNKARRAGQSTAALVLVSNDDSVVSGVCRGLSSIVAVPATHRKT